VIKVYNTSRLIILYIFLIAVLTLFFILNFNELATP